VGLGLRRGRLFASLETRLGLRHVGDREFADPEALAGRVELLHEHAHVVAARVGDADVLDEVGIGRHGREERRSARCRRGLGALGLDVGLRLLGLGDRLAAAEERLGDLQGS
jgi:hypothetical protein